MWGPPTMVPSNYPLHYGHFMDQYWNRQETQISSRPANGPSRNDMSFLGGAYSEPMNSGHIKGSIDAYPYQKQDLPLKHEEVQVKSEVVDPVPKAQESPTTATTEVCQSPPKSVPSIKQNVEMMCQFCGGEFEDLELLIGHINLHLEGIPEDEVTLRCMTRGCSYKPKVNGKKHSEGDENNGVSKMSNYTQLKSIQEHMRNKHLNMPAWRCTFCDKTFNSKASMDYHIRMHNDPTKEYCKICKHFKSIDKIALHDVVKCARLANAERKFECEDCGKRFKGAANLALHRVIHSQERFICDFCGKTFTQKGNRKTHMMKKHSSALLQPNLL